MVKRMCPKCGIVNYSAASQTSWKCVNCGLLLSPRLNKEIHENAFLSPLENKASSKGSVL